MNKRLLQRAIGLADGKSLIVQNDCGSACITQERNDAGKRVYRVETDGYLDRVFSCPTKALFFAMNDIADTMDGSPNR